MRAGVARLPVVFRLGSGSGEPVGVEEQLEAGIDAEVAGRAAARIVAKGGHTGIGVARRSRRRPSQARPRSSTPPSDPRPPFPRNFGARRQAAFD